MKPLSQFRNLNFSKLLLLSVSIIVIASCKNPTKDSASPEELNALSGIYSKDQADAAETIYISSCASCHGKDGRGTEGGSPLTGSMFQSRWQEKSIGALFEVTKRTMPKNSRAGAHG